MKMSKFWWGLRRWWHRPSMLHDSHVPPFPCPERIKLCFFGGKYKHAFRASVSRDLMFWIRNGLCWLRFYTPLSCKSSSPVKGWKFMWTLYFCDWLETQARKAEERENG